MNLYNIILLLTCNECKEKKPDSAPQTPVLKYNCYFTCSGHCMVHNLSFKILNQIVFMEAK